MSRRTAAKVTLALLLLPGIGYLLLFFGLPLLRVIAGSLELTAQNWTPSFRHYQTILQTPIFVDGLWFSIWLAIAPTVVSMVIGVPLAALLVTKFPGKNFFGALYKIPLVVPSIVAAFIVLVLVDRGGMAHRWLGVFGIGLPRMVRDPSGIGIILASAWKNVPFMALIVAGSMAAIPEDLKRAARTLGASTLTIFFRIQLPLALPGITAASLLIFISSLGAFAIPNILGPASPLPLSVHMYEQGSKYSRWPLVYAMGTILSLTAIVVLLLYYRLTRRVHRSLAAGEVLTVSTERTRWLITALLFTYALIALVLPLFVATLWSLVNPEDGWFAPDLIPPSFSLSFWREVTTSPGIIGALVTSIVIAIVVTTLTVALALPTAWALGRIPFRAKRLVEVFVLSPLIVPGIIVAVSLTEIFIRLGMFGTVVGVILVQTVGTLPLMIRILSASLESFPEELIWAARTLGARPMQVVPRLILPLVMPAIVAGGLLSFIASFEEFEKTFMVGAPRVQTIATKLWSYLNGELIIFPTAAVVTFILLVPTVIIFMIAQRVMKDEELAAGMGKL